MDHPAKLKIKKNSAKFSQRRWNTYRPRLEILECRTLLTTIHWINASGGSWHVPGNWDLQRVPDVGDDVVIDLAGDYSVTHSTGTTQIRSLTSARPFFLSGSSLYVGEQIRVDNTFVMTNAGLYNATIATGTTAQINNGSQFFDVTINGVIDITSGPCFLNGSWRNNGTIRMSSGTLTLAGNFTTASIGDLQISGGSIALIGTLDNQGATLTLNSHTGSWTMFNATIRGGTLVTTEGAVLRTYPNERSNVLRDVTIQGDVVVDNNSSMFISGAWRNRGVVTVNNSGWLSFGGTYAVDAIGVIHNMGVVDFFGTLNNVGTTLAFDGPSGWLFQCTLNGGVVTATNGAQLVTQVATLNGVTINGNISVNDTTVVRNGLTLNGIMTVQNSSRGALSFAGAQTLSGTASIVFGTNSQDPNSISADPFSPVIFRPGITVRSGFGRLQNVISQGTIIVDSADTNIIVEGEGWRNDGLVVLSAGSLTLGGQVHPEALGRVQRSGGFLDLTGTVDNQGRTLEINETTGSWRMAGGTIRGGSITATGSAMLLASDRGGTLDSVILNTAIQIPNNTRIGFAGTWRNQSTVTVNTGGTILLGGTFSPSAIGDLRANGGQIWLTGTLNNQGNSLVLNGSNNSWEMQGGSIVGGTITTKAGARLYGSGTLNNVNFKGDLAVFNPRGGGSSLRVVNGMTLDGTMTLGTSDFSSSTVQFDGSQLISGSGSIVFASYFGHVLRSTNGVAILGPGITVRDAGGTGELNNIINRGTILVSSPTTGITLTGDAARNEGIIRVNGGNFSFDGTFTVADLGTIERTGGNITFFGTLDNRGTIFALSPAEGSWRFSGTLLGGTIRGTAEATLIPSGQSNFVDVRIETPLDVQGATLNLLGAWVNRNTIRVNGGTLNLGGIFSAAALGTIQRTGGTVNLRGTVENTGQNLLLDAGTGNWYLDGGTIRGGSVTTNDGSQLLTSFAGGTLDGVTMNGSINMQGGLMFIRNGLTLNGDIQGNVTIDLSGTVAGTGTIMLRNYIFGLDTTAMIGPDITVRGNGALSSLTNLGNILATTAGASLSLENFVNRGTIVVNGSGVTLSFSGSWHNQGNLQLVEGTVVLGGQFTFGDLGNFQRTGGTFTLGGTLDNRGQTFTLDSSTGSWRMQAGTILGGTVTTTDGSSLLVGSHATLDGVTLATDLTIPADGDLTFTGNWQNQGQLTLNGGTLSLGGTVTLAFLGNFNRQGGDVRLVGTLENTGQTLALDDTTGSWRLSGGVINGGSVTTAGNARLLIDSGRLNGLTINGTVDASSGGFTVTNGLTLDGPLTAGFQGVTFDGTQTFSGTATITLAPGSFGLRGSNGVVTLGPGITVRGNALLANFVNQGTLELTAPDQTLTLQGTWRNAGLLHLAAGTLVLGGTFTTADVGSLQRTGGAVRLTGTLDNSGAILDLNETTGSWDIFNGSILRGTVTTENGALLRVSYGTFDGVRLQGELDVASFGQLTLAGAWTNQGTIRITNSNLYLGGIFTVADLGDIRRSGGRVVLTGTLENVGRTLALNAATGSWELAITSLINGGTVTTSEDASLRTFEFNQQSGPRFNAVTLNGNLIDVETPIVVTNGLTLNGTITLGVHNGIFGALAFNGSQTLSGTGTVIFGTASNSSLAATSGTVTIGPGITVRGEVGGMASFINQGTILIDQDEANALFSGSLWQNTGVVRLTAGTLSLGGSFTTAALGNFQRSGGTVQLTGVIGNMGSTLNLNSATGVWEMRGGAILGGTLIISPGGGLIHAGPIAGQLTGVDVRGDVEVESDSTLFYLGTNWRHQGHLTLRRGTVNFGGSFATAALPAISNLGGTVRLAGSLDNTGSTLNLDANTGSLQVVPGGSIREGTVNCSGATKLVANAVSSFTFTNLTLNCDLDLVNSRLNVFGTITFNGTVRLGGETSFGAVVFTIGNNIRLLGTGSVIFQGSDANHNALALGTFDFGNSITIGRDFTIRGTAGFIGYSSTYSGSTRSITLINEGTIRADGNGQTLALSGATLLNRGILAAQNGGQLSFLQQETSGYLVNEATLTVDSGSRFFSNVEFVQLGGSTSLNGGTITLPLVDIRAGSLSGSGTIVGNLINGGIIEIGAPASPGRIQILGDYTQSADGTLVMKIGGTDPGTGYDVLSITGTAILDGTLDITVVDGFFVHEGDTFTLLTFGQRTAELATINGLYPEGQKVFFDPIYSSNDFTLLAVPY